MKKITRKSLQVYLKKVFKIISYLFLAILFILMIDFLITVELREPSKYPYGFFAGDDYTYFGDGRFQILTEETKSLFDEKHYFEGKRISECLIYDIEKYLQIGKYVYFVGYYTCSSGRDENNNLHYEIPLLMSNSENYVWVDDIVEVPHYTILNYNILNYKTGDIQLYKTLEEAPEKDRKIFEKDLNFWCKFKRTCFEK